FDDLVGDQAVRFPVHRGGRVLTRGFHETKDLAGSLVVPVSNVVHSVLVLESQVLLVGVGNRNAGQSLNLVVNVEIQRHDDLLMAWIWRQRVPLGSFGPSGGQG